LASSTSLAPCKQNKELCYQVTPRRNQVCDLYRSGAQGKDGAWYKDPAVQAYCLDQVNDGRSVYLVTDDDVWIYDASFERILSLKDATGVDFASADVLELSAGYDHETGRFVYEAFTFISNKGKPNTINQCQITTAHIGLIDCLEVSYSSLGKVHDISCTLGGRACVVGAESGIYALERLTDAEKNDDSLKLTPLKPDTSSTFPTVVGGPVYKVAIQAFSIDADGKKKSFNGISLEPQSCTVDIAYFTSLALVRPTSTLSFGSVCLRGERPAYPTRGTKAGEAAPLWRHDWLLAFQQGPNDKNAVPQGGLRFTPEGALFFATADAVYRQAARSSASAPLAIERISSLEGLPFNNTQQLAAGQYIVPVDGAAGGRVSSQLYTATVVYAATPRGLVVIEKPGALADNQQCRDSVLFGEAAQAACQPGPSDYATDDDLARRSFRWMAGPRWLPTAGFDSPDSNSILSVSTSYFGRSTWVLLKSGIARIDYIDDFTLQYKANVIEGQVYPRHVHHGLVAQISMSTMGNMDTGSVVCSDNDGLWTAVYLGAQALKLALDPKDADTRDNVMTHLSAMKTLFDVTGKPGLPARSYQWFNESSGGLKPGWNNSTALKDFIWKGDTSSDEVTGHMFIYSLLSYLFPASKPDNAKIASMSRDLLTSLMAGILQNNYQLIDVTGKPTTWGRWDPKDMNQDQFFYDGRGVNSLQILSFINAANSFGDGSVLPRKTLQSHFNKLVVQYNYDQNLVNLKIQIPEDDNFSDDELTYLPYATWRLADLSTTSANAIVPQTAQQKYNVSAARTWKTVEPFKASLWTFIRALQVGGDNLSQANVDAAVEQLRRMPVEIVDWPFDNTLRNDVVISPYTGRDNTTPRVRDVLPPDESTAQRWNADWYIAQRTKGGFSEFDGGLYLLPYYLGRYLGLIN